MRLSIQLEELVNKLVEDYVRKNQAARIMRDALDEAGVGLFPVLDHITVRTLAIDKRAEQFIRLGYTYSETLHYQDWWAKVYRARGYPALFIDQAYEGRRGESSLIPHWVKKFGDETLHHIAIRVEDIDICLKKLNSKGVQFAGDIVGEQGSDLRQVFSVPEKVDGEPFSVLELTERHHGYQGFSPPQANSLMQSTAR